MTVTALQADERPFSVVGRDCRVSSVVGRALMRGRRSASEAKEKCILMGSGDDETNGMRVLENDESKQRAWRTNRTSGSYTLQQPTRSR